MGTLVYVIDFGAAGSSKRDSEKRGKESGRKGKGKQIYISYGKK